MLSVSEKCIGTSLILPVESATAIGSLAGAAVVVGVGVDVGVAIAEEVEEDVDCT